MFRALRRRALGVARASSLLPAAPPPHAGGRPPGGRPTPLHVRSVRALRRHNPFRVLQQHRNFRLFWIGQTLSLIGTWMQGMGEGWLALELTNNAARVTAVAAVASLPVLLLSLHVGVLVDRADKLRIVRMTQSAMLLQALTLWWLSWRGELTYPLLLALAGANGLFAAVEIPARQAMIVDLVGREDLREAIALNSSGFNLARVIGPAAGAFVAATLGMSWCFFVNALSYFAVLWGLFLIQLPPWRKVAAVVSPFEGIKQGLRYIAGTRDVFAIMLLVTVFSVFGVPYLTLMPVVARDVLGLGADGYGLLLASVGVGGLTGALFLAAVGPRVPRGRLLMTSALVYGTLLTAFALVRRPGIAYPVLFGAGFTMILNSAIANGMLQSLVPDGLRGRLMAVYSLVVVGLGQVVGAILAGEVAKTVGADWAIGGAAVAALGFTAWAIWRYPGVRALS